MYATLTPDLQGVALRLPTADSPAKLFVKDVELSGAAVPVLGRPLVVSVPCSDGEGVTVICGVDKVLTFQPTAAAPPGASHDAGARNHGALAQ